MTSIFNIVLHDLQFNFSLDNELLTFLKNINNSKSILFKNKNINFKKSINIFIYNKSYTYNEAILFLDKTIKEKENKNKKTKDNYDLEGYFEFIQNCDSNYNYEAYLLRRVRKSRTDPIFARPCQGQV